MENRTAEIIMICKGHHDYGKNMSHKQAIAAYLSDDCFCPIEFISDRDVNDVIWVAALDYVDGLKKPSSFLRAVMDSYNLHNNPLIDKKLNVDMFGAVCGAFSIAQVKADGCYINGFTKENTREVCRKHFTETNIPQNKEG